MQVPLAELKLQRRIGSGSSGTTYLASWRGSTVAVKVAGGRITDLSAWRAEVSALTRTPHALEIHPSTTDQISPAATHAFPPVATHASSAPRAAPERAELRHPHIVQYLGAVVEPPTHCIILEYCGGGDVLTALRAQGGTPGTPATSGAIHRSVPVSAVMSCTPPPPAWPKGARVAKTSPRKCGEQPRAFGSSLRS